MGEFSASQMPERGGRKTAGFECYFTFLLKKKSHSNATFFAFSFCLIDEYLSCSRFLEHLILHKPYINTRLNLVILSEKQHITGVNDSFAKVDTGICSVWDRRLHIRSSYCT